MFDKKLIHYKEKKSIISILFRVIFWSLTIIVFSFFILNSKYQNYKHKIIVQEKKIIKIEDGDTFQSLSNKLEINDIFLKYYLKNNIPNYELQKWTYKIEKNSDIWWIIESLNKPIINDMNITILEWWNIYDIDNILNINWYINKWEYIEYITSNDKIKKISEFFDFIEPNYISLEWFLYPDTYKINPNNFKINNFVINQLETFEQKVYKKILGSNNLNNKEILDLINLASIVEKEEKNNKNKPIVAWILKKRLDQWWMLWADITVCYPYKLTSEECKMVITKYINTKNEYNTRTMIWLPKTPIWNPSFDTIKSTLNFKETKYYFYLHNIETWEIYYWETNYEHENNKTKYIK